MTCTSGPLIYDSEGFDWSDLLALLDKFMAETPFDHPRGHTRQPLSYQHSLQQLNQHLLDFRVRTANVKRDDEQGATDVVADR